MTWTKRDSELFGIKIRFAVAQCVRAGFQYPLIYMARAPSGAAIAVLVQTEDVEIPLASCEHEEWGLPVTMKVMDARLEVKEFEFPA